MAEGLCRHLRGNEFDVFSAGVEKHGLNPLAVKVMQEIDIDISGHHSKTVDEVGDVKLDYVIAVCGHADETCPAFSGQTKRIYHGFDDPPQLAVDARNESDALVHYRRVRDDIKAYIEGLSVGENNGTTRFSG